MRTSLRAFSSRPRLSLCMAVLPLACLLSAVAHADPVATRRPQEAMHRAFVLKGSDGKLLAHAEEVATVQGDLVHSRLTFHFLDGSLDDEQVVFTQGKLFHVLSDHHIQKGKSFPTPLDLAIDVPSGTVTWHVTHFGHDFTKSEHFDLPSDLANGIMPLLVENFPPGAPEMRVSWIAVAVRPLVATISVKPATAPAADPPGPQANQFVIHPELHGFVSFLAPIVDKAPADIHIWVTPAKLPKFVRLTGPFYQGAPLWTVEPTGPATP